MANGMADNFAEFGRQHDRSQHEGFGLIASPGSESMACRVFGMMTNVGPPSFSSGKKYR